MIIVGQTEYILPSKCEGHQNTCSKLAHVHAQNVLKYVLKDTLKYAFKYPSKCPLDCPSNYPSNYAFNCTFKHSFRYIQSPGAQDIVLSSLYLHCDFEVPRRGIDKGQAQPKKVGRTLRFISRKKVYVHFNEVGRFFQPLMSFNKSYLTPPISTQARV